MHVANTALSREGALERRSLATTMTEIYNSTKLLYFRDSWNGFNFLVRILGLRISERHVTPTRGARTHARSCPLRSLLCSPAAACSLS